MSRTRALSSFNLWDDFCVIWSVFKAGKDSNDGFFFDKGCRGKFITYIVVQSKIYHLYHCILFWRWNGCFFDIEDSYCFYVSYVNSLLSCGLFKVCGYSFHLRTNTLLLVKIFDQFYIVYKQWFTIIFAYNMDFYEYFGCLVKIQSWSI